MKRFELLGWSQLERRAAQAKLRLFRTKFGVTIESADPGALPSYPFATITGGDLTDNDNDRLLRATVRSAIDFLHQLGVECRLLDEATP